MCWMFSTYINTFHSIASDLILTTFSSSNSFFYFVYSDRVYDLHLFPPTRFDILHHFHHYWHPKIISFTFVQFALSFSFLNAMITQLRVFPSLFFSNFSLIFFLLDFTTKGIFRSFVHSFIPVFVSDELHLVISVQIEMCVL